MKNLNKLLLVLFFAISGLSYGQIRIVNSISNSVAPSSSAFIDASSNNSNNGTTNIGKGLIYPRANLTTFAAFSGSPLGIPFSYPTRYDGMVVYNSVTGTAAIGGTAVTPGFYYYSNPTGTNVNGGKWVRFLADSDVSASTGTTYFGVLTTKTPDASDVQGLTTKSLTSGLYGGNFDQTISTEGYYTVVIPVSWRNPQLKIDGNETLNIIHANQPITINNIDYMVWQTDISLPAGMIVSIN